MATKTKRAGARKEADKSQDHLIPPKLPPASKGWTLSRGFRMAALRFAGRVATLGAAYWFLQAVVLQSVHFRIDPERGGVRVEGTSSLRPGEVARVFAPHFGRSLAAVDVSDGLLELRSIPWVQSASVARIWPRTIAVTVTEREPLAFLRLPGSNAVRMIDADGVILDRRGGGERSLPVLTGIDEGMPFEQRRQRLRLFTTVMNVFDTTSRGFAEGVSEIDVSDSGNAVVLAKHQDRMIKLQMGDRHLQHRLEVFLNYKIFSNSLLSLTKNNFLV